MTVQKMTGMPRLEPIITGKIKILKLTLYARCFTSIPLFYLYGDKQFKNCEILIFDRLDKKSKVTNKITYIVYLWVPQDL